MVFRQGLVFSCSGKSDLFEKEYKSSYWKGNLGKRISRLFLFKINFLLPGKSFYVRVVPYCLSKKFCLIFIVSYRIGQDFLNIW